jgi:hypothetical protein
VVNTFIPLPPCNCYPPRPPLQGPFSALDAFTTLTKPAQEKAADTTFVEESAQPGVDETTGEDVEAVDNAIGQQQAAPGAKLREVLGELVDRFTGERLNGGEEPSNTDNVTDAPDTVRAQGEVRGSFVATPTGQSSHPNSGATPRTGKLNEKLAELAQSLAPKVTKAPSSNDDGAGSLGDPGAGDTADAQ